MAQLAIKGHATRGKEVIEILRALGGVNTLNYAGINDYNFYHIGESGTICSSSMQHNRIAFTLEEFLEKYPYKIGDKVSSKYLKNYGISKMEWDYLNDRVIYQLQEMGWYSTYELRPYKKETMGEKLEEITLDIPGGYEFFGINDDNQVVLTKKHIQYPKTYEECCRIIDYHLEGTTIIGYEKSLLENFQKLLICRDAYWKIAGEQIGLGKPWEFKLGSDSKEVVYAISVFGTGIMLDFYYALNCNKILVFPTEEVRDAFYKNFKYLIEQCKELL